MPIVYEEKNRHSHWWRMVNSNMSNSYNDENHLIVHWMERGLQIHFNFLHLNFSIIGTEGYGLAGCYAYTVVIHLFHLCDRSCWSMMSAALYVRRKAICSPATTVPAPTTWTASTHPSGVPPRAHGAAPSARRRWVSTNSLYLII